MESTSVLLNLGNQSGCCSSVHVPFPGLALLLAWLFVLVFTVALMKFSEYEALGEAS